MITVTEHVVYEGDWSPQSSPPPHSDLTSHAAANLFDINGCTGIGREGAAQNTSRPNRIVDHGVHTNLYATPERMNLHENGLCRSPCLRKQREKEKETSQKRKAHISFGTAAATKLGFGLFSLIALATNVVVPHHQTEKDATFTQQVMNRLHEVNYLYDSTLNEVHHLLYATDISSNDRFNFWNAMKQDDKLAFVDAMEKEISNHEKGGHWSIVHRDTLSNNARPIKEIWSFKRKRKPDGELLKHKARLCAHGGMQKWGDSYWETYSPVVNMLYVRLILAIAKLQNIDSKAIDFVPAFP